MSKSYSKTRVLVECALMVALDRTGMVRFRREQAGTQAAGN